MCHASAVHHIKHIAHSSYIFEMKHANSAGALLCDVDVAFAMFRGIGKPKKSDTSACSWQLTWLSMSSNIYEYMFQICGFEFVCVCLSKVEAEGTHAIHPVVACIE